MVRLYVLLAAAVMAYAQEKPDPFRTGQVDKLSTTQAIVIAAQSGLSIGDMVCIVDPFLGRDTRAITCGLSGNRTYYTGTLTARFTDQTYHSRQVRIEQPIDNGVMATWGITAMTVYGSKELARVEFAGEGLNIFWEQTQAARNVLNGTYNYPKADTYPPPVHIAEMLCKVSEFLIDPKGQYVNMPTYVVTCGMAGDAQYYAGNIHVWWHLFESRIAEKKTPPPVPKELSVNTNAQRVQHVFVQHDLIDGALSYWGVTAFGIQSNERRAFDRLNFYPDSEEQSWTVATVPLAYSRGRLKSFKCWLHLPCKQSYIR
jgi:hypothetical protein